MLSVKLPAKRACSFQLRYLPWHENEKQEMLALSLKPVSAMKVMHKTGCGLTLKQFLQTFAVQVHSTIAMVSMSRLRTVHK